MSIPRGTAVQQIITPITGVVDGDYRVDQQTGKVQIPVAFTDSNGVENHRYFDEAEIEVVPGAVAPSATTTTTTAQATATAAAATPASSAQTTTAAQPAATATAAQTSSTTPASGAAA